MQKTKTVLSAIAALMLTGSTVAATPPPVKPLYGNINPFYGNIGAYWGNINPFWGDIGAFWGNINPFWGDIGAFWGNINPFYGDIGAFYGNINPFAGDVKAHYGNIGAFWGNISPFWTDINAAWGTVAPNDAAGLAAVSGKLSDMVARSKAFWGAAVEARTGKSFEDAFMTPLLAKFGLDLANPASLAGKTAAQRWEFMITWYDQLMEFSGMDHVDHWMKTINWTPAITEQQGEGKDAIIGLIDFTIAGDADVKSKLSYFNGVSTFTNGHGAGVASLIVAAHDGRGVMGIAPNASVVAYNPFDATGTTSFADIKNGIVALNANNAGIINMSLGVTGWTLHPDWKGVFSDPQVAASYRNTVYVIAAGNDGSSQSTNIAWDWANDPALIVVGSVGPDGTISNFSNRPGTACLLDAKAKCNKDAQLMNRFMVAPGELILVSDDHGGVTRQSGTSLAAPLVSGTIALLLDRWPWLADYPKATVEILLRSAKDLGAKGVDPVYGWGLLDVAAAQSVLDFSKLKFYEVSDLLAPTNLLGFSAKSAGKVRSDGIKTSWEASGAYFIVFEDADKTERDFAIPLSSRLYGQKVAGSGELFQQFIYDRLVEWIKGGKQGSCTLGLLCMTDGVATLAFADSSVTLPAFDGLNLSFGYTSRQDDLFAEPASEMMLRLGDAEGTFALNAGYGRGAAVLGFQGSFSVSSDYAADGGVNPLLGFAQGGAYAGANITVGAGFSLSAGMTAAGGPLVLDDVYGRISSSPVDIDFDAYDAEAFTFAASYQAGADVTLHVAYTQLDEKNGVLGVRAMQDDFTASTITDGMTIGGDLHLGGGFTLGLSATVGKTRTSSNDLAVADAIESTAFEAALAKRGVFGENDFARITFSQPLHVEAGTMAYSQVGVVNRLTGELGVITQTFDIASAERRFQGELLYATPFLEGRGEIGAFAKAALVDDGMRQTVEDYSGGMTLRFSF
ncbi:hypothetical protein sos41_40210 [Alphaproteobacteria bacterium SO-S41]|nr:hypothetical protein sos41_40210 [Alphaproteobacteria bacterium SO-S41]